MRAVLVHRHAIAHFEHIGVVPMSRSGVSAQGLTETYALHDANVGEALGMHASGIEVAPDVGTDTPAMPYLAGPFPRLMATPFTHTHEDRAPSCAEGITHELIGTLGVDIGGVTPVLLQIINFPPGILQGILILMSQTAWQTSTSASTAVAVDTQFQAFCVNVVCQRFHTIGKLLGVTLDEPVGITLTVPTVVDVDVLIAGFAQSAGHHRIGNTFDNLF